MSDRPEGPVHTYETILQDSLDLYFEGESFAKTVAKFLCNKRDIHLEEEEAAKVAQSMRETPGPIAMRLTAPDGVVLAFETEELTESLEDLGDLVAEAASPLIDEMIEKAVPEIVDAVRRSAGDNIHEVKANIQVFEGTVSQVWGKPLRTLYTILGIAQEALYRVQDDEDRVLKETDSVGDLETISMFWQSLTSLHIRACRTLAEILVLLEAGMADGAMARWRSLHEYAVTMSFIAEKRGDIGKRYLLHSNIRKRAMARDIANHVPEEALDNQSDVELEQACQELTDTYGTPFKTPYGWAAEAMQQAKPTFWAIEKEMNMQGWRPYYGLANQSVHADPNGAVFSLADDEGPWHGGSIFGLCDPGANAAASMGTCVAVLLGTCPVLDWTIAAGACQKFVEQANDEFLECHRMLEEEYQTESEPEQEISE
ncbi:MAG: DUF5677 domain-containing protein [Planctomycetota bacterium]